MVARVVFDGTPTTVVSTSATVAAGEWSAEGQSTEFDNTGTSDKWMMFRATLAVGFSTSPAAGAVCSLWVSDTDVDGTPGHDLDPANGTTQNNARLVAIFSPLKAATATQYVIAKFNASELKTGLFQVKNETGVVMASGAVCQIEGISSEEDGT